VQGGFQVQDGANVADGSTRTLCLYVHSSPTQQNRPVFNTKSQKAPTSWEQPEHPPSSQSDDRQNGPTTTTNKQP
jgi:hypothetical protein